MVLDDLFDSEHGAVGKIIDTLSLSATQKRELEMQLMSAFYEHTEQEIRLRAEIMAKELNGNWLQRSWRPLVMLAFATVVVLGCFIEVPFLDKNSGQVYEILNLGMGGYVVGKSVEGISSQLLRPRRKR